MSITEETIIEYIKTKGPCQLNIVSRYTTIRIPGPNFLSITIEEDRLQVLRTEPIDEELFTKLTTIPYSDPGMFTMLDDIITNELIQ